MQAEVLARYRPKINVTTLNLSLKREEQMITNTLNYFKKTHHIILFYEDVVRNRTVSPSFFSARGLFLLSRLSLICVPPVIYRN